VEILYAALLAAAFLALLYRLFVLWQGNMEIQIKSASRSRLKAVRLCGKTAVLQAEMEMENTGKQIAIFLDCFTRHLLPYEQFDGVRVQSRLMRADAVREDDYFEAYLLKQRKKTKLLLELTLTARHEETIQEALSQMVDLPVEIIYQAEARGGMRFGKERVVFGGAEIAAAAGCEWKG